VTGTDIAPPHDLGLVLRAIAALEAAQEASDEPSRRREQWIGQLRLLLSGPDRADRPDSEAGRFLRVLAASSLGTDLARRVKAQTSTDDVAAVMRQAAQAPRRVATRVPHFVATDEDREITYEWPDESAARPERSPRPVVAFVTTKRAETLVRSLRDIAEKLQTDLPGIEVQLRVAERGQSIREVLAPPCDVLVVYARSSPRYDTPERRLMGEPIGELQGAADPDAAILCVEGLAADERTPALFGRPVPIIASASTVPEAHPPVLVPLILAQLLRTGRPSSWSDGMRKAYEGVLGSEGSAWHVQAADWHRWKLLLPPETTTDGQPAPKDSIERRPAGASYTQESLLNQEQQHSVLARLDAASKDAASYFEIANCLNTRSEQADQTSGAQAQLDALRAALYFVERDGTLEGTYAGSEEAPWPKEPHKTGPERQQEWAQFADTAEHPGVRARLHHLLYAAGHPPKHVHARSAISNYQAAVHLFFDAHEQPTGRVSAARCLTSALNIALAMKQGDLRDAVVQDMLTTARTLLAGEDKSAGLIMHLLEPLSQRGLAAQDVHHLARGAEQDVDDVLLKTAFLALARRTATDASTQQQIDEAAAQAWIDEARQHSGMRKVLALNQAATAARDAGLTKLRDEAIRELQAVDIDSLGLVPIRSAVSQQPLLLDAYLARIDAAGNLREALETVAALDSPPAGRAADAERFATMAPSIAPLAATIARGRVNSSGPIPVSASGTDGQDGLQAQWHTVALLLEGDRVAAQLDRLQGKADEHELLAAFAHSELGRTPRLRMLAHAFQHFWLHEDDAAIHLALPQVESLLREALRSHQIPVLQLAQGKTVGGVSQLGTLIAAMPKAGFSEDWTRSLKLLLTDPEVGLNLRNDALHGLRDCPSHGEVALVLQAALFLLFHASPEQEQISDATS
jgi:hypothetical protein